MKFSAAAERLRRTLNEFSGLSPPPIKEDVYEGKCSKCCKLMS